MLIYQRVLFFFEELYEANPTREMVKWIEMVCCRSFTLMLLRMAGSFSTQKKAASANGEMVGASACEGGTKFRA